MNNQIILLKQLGLNEKEAKVYLAALEYGPTTLTKIANKSGIKRTSIYDFIDDMVARGLIISTVLGRRALYAATEPEHLGKLIEKQKEVLSSLIPELSMYKRGSEKPRIRFYEGKQGVVYVYNEVLKLPSGSEVVGYATFDSIYKIYSKEEIDEYIKARVKKGISQRLIMPNDQCAINHIDKDKNELRENIMIPLKDFPITNEINIFENKVMIVSLGEEKVGVIIESQQIADTQKIIFDYFWKTLRVVSKNKIKIT